MEEFAKYILNEDDLISKIEIIYFLAPKLGINFDKSIVFKTEIARMFLRYTNVKVDNNLVLTASLLCNCKKVDDAQKIGKLQTYAKEGAEHLKTLGFDERFCKICEGINRYSKLTSREKESDILELVDQFGGMLIDRPERIGFNPDEAMVLLEHRNLRGEYNRYLENFRQFVNAMEKIRREFTANVSHELKTPLTTISGFAQMISNGMAKTEDITEFAKKIALDYSPSVDKKLDELKGIITEPKIQSNRAMFSSESEEKILKHIKN